MSNASLKQKMGLTLEDWAQQRFGQETGVHFIPKEIEMKGFGGETVFQVLTLGILDARAKVCRARDHLRRHLQQR